MIAVFHGKACAVLVEPQQNPAEIIRLAVSRPGNGLGKYRGADVVSLGGYNKYQLFNIIYIMRSARCTGFSGPASVMSAEQLAALYRYIAAAASPEMAERYTGAIVTFCEGLQRFPHRGAGRDDIRPGLRITNYIRMA